ncbi:RsmB/NOP family class I SAM-dependent RNA methyltransferase [Labrys monachus]|uniref:16S rRNA (Cytosine967-C5)-methyltransferase n=1 Tax=Labrys monachus TaxID=217067 RepID=A0ABU0FP57_9HYPH|nr:RsmB/NOP family class I SAM-dependent RNA methyltransferase [Labrys monachus]MDQ0396398.1 16S rRNA (cytosine967-C5)-methyltransferase [Labrys monachus]
MPRPTSPSSRPDQVPGLAARALAMRAIDGVLARNVALEDAFEASSLEPRDLALARMIAGVAMRRYGTIGTILDGLLAKGMPRKSGPLEAILITAAAQILFLDVPDHAAVDLAIRLARQDDRAQAFSGLANAVLRKVSAQKAEHLAAVPPEADTPAWLLERWRRHYGEDTARAIAAAQRFEPPLDLTVKTDAAGWADRLGGRVLPTGSVRLAHHGPVSALEGYAEGQWWVQDAAAALPARLLGRVEGLAVADLCAAPGGKTAQLAQAGARVTAVDRSENRLIRLRENLGRLGLEAAVTAADILAWKAAPFDAVILDAPCSATGTIRRHPDVAWSKSAGDVAAVADLQRRMLGRMAELVKPGGLLVYCTCSLEAEEGEDQIARLLAGGSHFTLEPVTPADIGGLEGAITPQGYLRTLPSLLPDPDPVMSGMDGFFAARLRRAG